MEKNHVEFVPVVLSNDTFIEDINQINPEFNENIVKVFDYYSVDYSIENDKIWITKKLKKDQDLLWNYCNKAKDDSWLKEHAENE